MDCLLLALVYRLVPTMCETKREIGRERKSCVCVCFNFCVCVCMLVEDVDYRVIFQWAMLECTAVVVLPVLGLFWLSEGC